MPENADIFNCKICNFVCSRKSNFDIHIRTAKHKHRTILNNFNAENAEENINQLSCNICKKTYKFRNSLWYHEKKCNMNNNMNSEIDILKSIVIEVIKSNTELQKQNTEMQKQMIDVCKNIQPATINNHNSNINSNNKTFNLQVFLNEDCKDAMNIKDFMNSFVLQIKDLEKVGKLGYVDGITDIIIQKLKELDIKQRPMHCSDFKRETIYVKDEGIWEKEGPTNNKVKKVVGHVSKHNMNLLNSWKDLHPCCLNSSSPHNGHYLHLIKESLGGPEDMDLTESKIVKKISKEIIIDKK
jgi:hypothetical protein